MNTATFASPPASACTLGTAGIYGADRITKCDYDNESRTTKVTSGYLTADSGIDRQTTYTNNGQVATLADGKGNITTYLYDGHDRLNRVNFPNATTILTQGVFMNLMEGKLWTNLNMTWRIYGKTQLLTEKYLEHSIKEVAH